MPHPRRFSRSSIYSVPTLNELPRDPARRAAAHAEDALCDAGAEACYREAQADTDASYRRAGLIDEDGQPRRPGATAEAVLSEQPAEPALDGDIEF